MWEAWFHTDTSVNVFIRILETRRDGKCFDWMAAWLHLDFNTRWNADVLSTDMRVQLDTIESFKNFKILNSEF
jgi:hypothetical protein